LARIRACQAAAAAQRQAEAERVIEPLTDRLAQRINYLRARELRGWLMIEAEINECRRRENEMEKDLEDYSRIGNASRDWTK
jgi:hypothetical protein